MIMTVSSRIIVSTVIVLVVLTVQSAAAQQAPVPPRGNQPTNASEPRATNGTVYTNKTELFATFRPPFIVGQATRSALTCPNLDAPKMIGQLPGPLKEEIQGKRKRQRKPRFPSTNRLMETTQVRTLTPG